MTRRRALRALAGRGWEIVLPLIILVSYFSGFATLVETAALSVIYALVVEVVDPARHPAAGPAAVFSWCVPVIGGVLIILTVAKGLSFYVVDAQIPARLTELAARERAVPKSCSCSC